jgi:hypothetical protein
MSDYQKYFNYKMKYLHLKNKLLKGGSNLMYNKKITNLPTEYLQNIIYTIITQHHLNINDFYINYILEQNTSSSKPINIYIYSSKEISDDIKLALINKLDEKLNKFAI